MNDYKNVFYFPKADIWILKTDEDTPINMPEPPKIFSTLPNGVSIESNATVPTISNLFIYCILSLQI